MIKSVLIFSLSFLFLGLFSQATSSTELVYSEDFESNSTLDEWVMEGPGLAEISDGKLFLQSKYARQTQEYLDVHGSESSYYNLVEELMEKDLGEAVNDYKIRDKFVGGHIVFWNKFEAPDNYILEFDFQSLSDYSLHMIMFSHLGINGESVFSPLLKPRNGLGGQYTNSDMVGYRISYFAPGRGSTNLRKSPEKKVLIKGDDLTLLDKKAVHKMRVIKNGRSVTWQINGTTAFIYEEKDPDKELGGGYFGIRLMVPAVGLYDNVRLFEILLPQTH